MKSICLLYLILAIVVQLGRAQILANASSPVVKGSGESVLNRKKYIASKDLPKIAINIKKRIESGGTWEK
jgi:hypothetical protein